MSRDGEKHQQPPPPLSSFAATAAGFSPVTLMASSVTTVVKLAFFPSNDPSPLLNILCVSELLMKLGEMCGTSLVLNLRCQLPTEDLDALVSITSDEDLANLIEEYDRVAPPPAPPSLKIRAFLSTPKTTEKVSPPPSNRGGRVAWRDHASARAEISRKNLLTALNVRPSSQSEKPERKPERPSLRLTVSQQTAVVLGDAASRQ
ncbi:putative Octicosapeptide/Phox/Bem1p family protein [Abeliophyllum distichum]|uniref:Octicosapeptide/Phox/Bem1p family protein n=1 Tax=Abeliophyllum distichum TaxID=126358 RepID=A0ABD1TKH6_9LAMI